MRKVLIQVVVNVPAGVEDKDVAGYVREAVETMSGSLEGDAWQRRLAVQAVGVVAEVGR